MIGPLGWGLRGQSLASERLAPRGPGWAPQPKWKKSATTLSGGRVSGPFSAATFFPGRTPTGRKRRFGGFAAHFVPWALREMPGPGRKTRKGNFPVLGALLGKKFHTAAHKGSPRNSATSGALRFDRPDPHGREIAKDGGFSPFWPRTAFGTGRNSGRKTENTRPAGPRAGPAAKRGPGTNRK